MKTAGTGKYDHKKLGMLRWAKEFTVILIVAIVLFRLFLGISFISGNSMHPTVKNNAPVIYWRLDKSYDRGEIVSVRMPNGEYLIKRVIAVGGDTVDVRDGAVTINGEPEQGAYLYGTTALPENAASYPLTVPEGHVYLLGDNREVSVDSRSYGTVSVSQIRGTILFKK